MNAQRRTFETRGPVDPAVNYVVPRSDEIRALVERIKRGRYTVIFAPRQTGKTTFFRWALDTLVAEDDNYFPIQLNFETFGGDKVEVFYSELQHEMRKEILREFQRRGWTIASEFQQFLETYQLKDHHTFGRFLENLAVHLEYRKVAIIIDEFDGIPQVALTNFLHTLRRIYLAKRPNRCPHSVGIVGIRSISQLSYDRSISPFNIQDDFDLPNFTLEQVRGLLSQYTEETRQTVAADVLDSLYEMTAGQPFLVNRLAQILTEEMEIPLSETIEKAHFVTAHQQILAEDNTHLSHLTTNIRRNPRFESVLMRITSYQEGVRFTVRNELISELATYGVVKRGKAGFCEIANPIYQYCIIDAFRPLFNGLEREYHPEDTRAGFLDYLTPEGTIDMLGLLKNFRDFIARAGYRILEVPDKPQEFVGQYLLFAYLDQFVLQVQGFIYAETYTGRGRMDLIILHNGRKYIVETKIWEGDVLYQRGKNQLVGYLELEGVDEGYYVVFDHRKKPNALQETEVIEGKAIMSFCIPVVQERPSDAIVTD
jgi:hypothetical protein